MISSRQVGWSWDGTPVTVGLDTGGRGADVLLLPALSSISTRAEMRPLLDRLMPSAHVVTADWPGFGEQERPSLAWTPETRLVVAAGHAAGYALHYAASHPGRIDRLALIAPTWRGPLPTMAGGDRPLFRHIRKAIGLPVLGPLLYRLNVNRPVVRMMLAEHVYADPRSWSRERLIGKRRVIDAPGARFGSAAFVTGGLDRVASRVAFLDLVRQAGVPVLMIYGAQTPARSRAEMEALGAAPGVRSHQLPRGKLGLHEEYPDEVARVLEPFLLTAREA